MKNYIVSLLAILLFPQCLLSQTDYTAKYFNTLNNPEVDNNVKRIKQYTLNQSALKFMELGYFINGNNILANYEYNDVVINNLIKTGTNSGSSSYRWIVTDVGPNSMNASMKGKEFILYEGYLFRYIAQYQYENPDNSIDDIDFVKKNFFKWYDRSVRDWGDASSLYGIRLHMGSHWATVAAYLTKLDPENKQFYLKFINEFDRQLRRGLKIKKVNGEKCYVWNSTYERDFTNSLKKRKKEVGVQDVSHGNHIIQYVVDSYNLGLNSWKKRDLERFANTAKFIVWGGKTTPSDLVDGTDSNLSGIKGMGWKQSDGWMKLMNVLNDKDLYDIYDRYYTSRASKVDKFYPNLQFFANMAVFQEKNAIR